jgi:pyruvate dehydrogenase E1 component alpha subunit
MPRTTIELSDRIEYLSILDEQGGIDIELEPELPEDFLLKLYRGMLLGRRFDERLLNLQRQGRIGTFPPISGQEAAHIGAVSALKKTDWMVPAFRETPAEIWRGRSLESVIIYNNGFGEGGIIPKEVKNLPISVPVGSQILHAVGLGWAAKYRKTDEVILSFFGDGATSEGDFHEGLNFAGVFQTPTVFICQNNQWAISIPIHKQTRSQTLAQKALAYGLPGIRVDGNDILAVYTASKEAVERARTGGGPTLIECVTYRMTMHTTADDPKRYRSDEEVESWRKKDPIDRFQKYLTSKKILSPEKIESIESSILEQIQAAVDNAEEQMKQMGDPIDMFDHVFEEMPDYLSEQREGFIREQSMFKAEENNG